MAVCFKIMSVLVKFEKCARKQVIYDNNHNNCSEYLARIIRITPKLKLWISRC